MCANNSIRIDVGELHVSNDSTQTLLTYALGSCIGLAVHDVRMKVGGLAHIQLPDSPKEWNSRPEGVWAYADRAIPELFNRLYAYKANRRDLRIVMAGGASILDATNFFQIGRKNYLSVKKLLWRDGYIASAEATGGTEWRTMRLEIGTGRVEIQTPNGRETL
jgi:chemotaxis protein CheD